MDLTRATRVGVVSDTHDLVRPELFDLLAGVDAVLHAGDLGDDQVETELAAIAPFYAVAGNVDGFDASKHPRYRLFRVGSTLVGMTHVAIARGALTESVEKWVAENAVDLLIFGHTHVPLVRTLPSGLTLFNPGSCGPQRFSLPISAGYLEVRDGRAVPELVPINAAP